MRTKSAVIKKAASSSKSASPRKPTGAHREELLSEITRIAAREAERVMFQLAACEKPTGQVKLLSETPLHGAAENCSAAPPAPRKNTAIALCELQMELSNLGASIENIADKLHFYLLPEQPASLVQRSEPDPSFSPAQKELFLCLQAIEALHRKLYEITLRIPEDV